MKEEDQLRWNAILDRMNFSVTPDTEHTLSFGDQRAVVSPWGGSLRRYFVVGADGSERDIVWGYSGGSHKKGGQGDVLIPFPGRIPQGRYAFAGETFQLELNDKEGPNAIHGFVRTQPWRCSLNTMNEVAYRVDVDEATYGSKGYPFSLAIQIRYRLDENSLSCTFEIENAGRRAAPVGAGFHPYFTVGTTLIDEAVLRLPCAGLVEFSDRLLPTGKILSVEGTEWDYRAARPIGGRRFNHCYVQLERDTDGIAVASLSHAASGRTIEVFMDRSFSSVVVYSGEAITSQARRALAIEPMTCATDAFNHPEWGLAVLDPGQRFTGRYTVRYRVDA